ncbi:unnamed protein product, partial [Amoebophrya sp. A25]
LDHFHCRFGDSASSTENRADGKENEQQHHVPISTTLLSSSSTAVTSTVITRTSSSCKNEEVDQERIIEGTDEGSEGEGVDRDLNFHLLLDEELCPRPASESTSRTIFASSSRSSTNEKATRTRREGDLADESDHLRGHIKDAHLRENLERTNNFAKEVNVLDSLTVSPDLILREGDPDFARG